MGYRERQKCFALVPSTRRQESKADSCLPGSPIWGGLPGPDSGHLATGLGPTHPTFPRKLTGIRASKRGQQKAMRLSNFSVLGKVENILQNKWMNTGAKAWAQSAEWRHEPLGGGYYRLRLHACLEDLQGLHVWNLFKEWNSKVNCA